MKRLYACLFILCAIIAFALLGKKAVNSSYARCSTSLASITDSLSSENIEAAQESIQELLTFYRRQIRILSIFVRQDTLSSLEVTLCAMQKYAEESNIDEALAEAERAQSQLTAIRRLFFRML